MPNNNQSPEPTTPTQSTGSLNARLPFRDLGNSQLQSVVDEGSFFVGSPDQFHGEDPVTPHLTSNTLGLSNSVPRSRPIPPPSRLSPNLLLTRRRAANPRIVSGLSSLVMGTPESDHRWTLFGQLMENEGQLPISPTAPGGRRLSISSHPIPSQESRDSTSNLTTTHSITIDPFLDPVADEGGQSVSRLPSDASSYRGSATPTNNDEYDSSDEETDPFLSSEPLPLPWYSLQRIPNVPILYRNVLKCAIAYFVASLFTFNPFLANLLSKIASYGHMDHGPGSREPFPSGHMVATIAVYYNPAKTKGGMIEANLFCLMGLFYAAFVCLSSMNMFWWLELSPGWEWLGDLVAILWFGVSMSIVSWFKVWMSNPSFNTACSMAAIIISVVVVKEGGLPTLLQVSTIVICGSLISNLVCYLIWPQSAIDNLQTNMTKTLDSFSTVLSMLTNTFLLEGGVHNQAHLDKMQRAVENHQSSFTSLKKSILEARTEWLGRGNPVGALPEETGKWAYEDAVNSLNRLGQHLNGLRSGTRLQYELTKAGVVKNRRRKHKGSPNRPVGLDVLMSTDDDEETAMLKAAAIMFGDLVDDLGPPLKALSGACIMSLKRLREAFEQSKSRRRKNGSLFKQDEFLELVDAIERALVRFESTSNYALLRWYRRNDGPPGFSPRPRSISSLRETSIYSFRGEDLDKIFIFTLQELSREVVSLIDAMRRIYRYEKDCMSRGHWWQRIYRDIRNRLSRSSPVSSRKKPGLKRTFSSYIIPDIRRPVPSFPKVRPHAPNTMQTPSSDTLNMMGRVKQAVWKFGNRLTERDTKYAFKVGMSIAILAIPAFYDATRPIFVKYWGDWALISFFAVMSPTIGATNYLGLQRILGTLFGAVVAASIFTLYSQYPAVLAIFGFFFSLPCFYYAVARPEYLSASRFVLLTYNLTCLYCYNLRRKELSVARIAADRALAVTAGVIWAAFISRFWWPAEARRELGKALGEFCLNIGWLYTRLVASNSFAPEYQAEINSNETEAAAASLGLTAPSKSTKLNNSIKEFMSMELHLQIKLIELQGLLAQTQHEPRLKGPFPILLYREILTSLQTILDRLHSMRCVTTREEWYTSVRQDFIIPVNKERHEMVGNILLSLSTLASAFRLKAPLPPYLPPVEESRQRLVDAIRRLDVVRNRDVKGSRQLLFFAYALTMKGVTEELESLGQTMQSAFGVIGGSAEEFEALFMYSEDGRRRLDYAA
ncbi:hypothetical protein C0995_002176 [Termitomyces sp. Mi166|nr:hypothetical protein C0995_002176 [Termitomyces sp. Mi166\